LVLANVNGKFLGALLLIVMAIIPTFIYVAVISSLGMPEAIISIWEAPLVLILDYCS
jgi:hypothetical protein